MVAESLELIVEGSMGSLLSWLYFGIFWTFGLCWRQFSLVCSWIDRNFSLFVVNLRGLEPRHVDWLQMSAWLFYFGWATFHLDWRARRKDIVDAGILGFW